MFSKSVAHLLNGNELSVELMLNEILCFCIKMSYRQHIDFFIIKYVKSSLEKAFFPNVYTLCIYKLPSCMGYLNPRRNKTGKLSLSSPSSVWVPDYHW